MRFLVRLFRRLRGDKPLEDKALYRALIEAFSFKDPSDQSLSWEAREDALQRALEKSGLGGELRSKELDQLFECYQREIKIKLLGF